LISSKNENVARNAHYKESSGDDKSVLENDIYKISTPVIYGGRQIGMLYQGFSLEKIKTEISATKKTILHASLLIFVLGTIGVIGISYLLMNPIHKMIGTVLSISQGDLSQRTKINSDDEIGRLAKAFNEMVDNLQASQEELKAANERSEKRAQQLQVEIVERQKAEQEREAIHKELNEVARRAGMADVATSVLHNVGNVLNTVNTSVAVLRDTMDHSKLAGLYKANEMLRVNFDTIDDFITNDKKGKMLLEYYLTLEDLLRKEQVILTESMNKLEDKVSVITDIITSQQNYSMEGLYAEKMILSEVIDSAMKIQQNSIAKNEINLHKIYNSDPEVKIQKIKLVHILVNLYKNAKEAMMETEPAKRILKIELNNDHEYAYITISDTGPGIRKEDMGKIFNHGFTTKEKGHGFGLHSCANYMTEMGGKMWAESDGKSGATFVLQFPLNGKPDSDMI
ncbi:MAG: PAS domain-containing sensor histidine kinase, partial [Calditrichaceae bacterium]